LAEHLAGAESKDEDGKKVTARFAREEGGVIGLKMSSSKGEREKSKRTEGRSRKQRVAGQIGNIYYCRAGSKGRRKQARSRSFAAGRLWPRGCYGGDGPKKGKLLSKRLNPMRLAHEQSSA